jgi:hypothetical protein
MPPRRRSRRDRLAKSQTHALNHPLRLRILEMDKRARGRPLQVETLMAVLAETREYKNAKAAEVQYHRDRLVDADLLSD